MVADKISHLITKLKNGSKARKLSVSIPFSGFVGSVLDLLLKNGYIKSINKSDKGIVKEVEVELAYESDGTPKLQDVERISKLSKRIYKGSKDLKPVRQGYGMLVVSTSKGVMSGDDAKKAKIGGEALFKIW